MALKAITINDLWHACVAQRKKGNGNKTIVVASDEEGNSFNEIYFTFTDDRETKELCQINSNKDIDKVILLG